MAQSARKLLNRNGAMVVNVDQFKQFDEDNGALSFTHEGVQFADMFNVNDPDVMKTLISDKADGTEVRAQLLPDDNDDDGHPSISEAKVV